MSDFTPGPWYWDTDNGWLVADDPDDELFGFLVLAPDIDNARIAVDPNEPDARLIAAAPELYEIAQGLIDISNRRDIGDHGFYAALFKLASKAEAALALVDKETR